MANRLAPSKLDEIASPEAQQAWIASPPSGDVAASRKFPELGDGDDGLSYLVKTPEWPSLALFLRAYIRNSIFRPFETERLWWNVTIGGGGTVRINIWRQYVIVIRFRVDPSDSQAKASGFAYVDREQLETALNSGRQLGSGFEVRPGTYDGTDEGKPMVGHERPQLRIEITGATTENLAELFNADWMLSATRTLNLDLMRGGMLGRGKSDHVSKLVDAIFADEPNEIRSTIGATEVSVDDAQIAMETEEQRLAWIRKNQAKFSKSVRRIWNFRCAVTGVEAERVLQACHIKSFNESNDIERLDEYNGLCLSANIHSAFDAHLIGFAPTGEICLSDRLSHEDRRRMGLNEVTTIELSDRHRPYIAVRYARFLKANPSKISNDEELEATI